MAIYPRATHDRLRFGEHGWGKGHAFFRAVLKNFTLLQLLFFALFGWVFGSLYQQGQNVHRLGVVFVDYDEGGAIGAAVLSAYQQLQADIFPTLIQRPPADYPTPDDLRSAVCATKFWAAVYVTAGASDRLQNALGGGPPALAYDPDYALTLIWNQARYSAVIDGVIASNMQTLSTAARVAYSTGSGTGNLTSVSSPEALSVLANPWVLGSDNIQPTTQGSRAIYNTLVIILIIIQEFFYLGTINNMYTTFKIYTTMHPSRIIVVRNINSIAYTMIGSLCTTGAIWAFRSGWHVNGAQFALTWMTLWLFAHVNFLTIDVFTIWLPPVYVPMAFISWIIVNVTSIMLPLELSHPFYQVGYLFPVHEIYQVLLDVWSAGCNPRLHYALPVLFAWEVGALALSGLGVFRRSHYADIAEEAARREFEGRVDAAVDLRRQREGGKEEGETVARAKAREAGVGGGEDEAEESSERIALG